VTQDKTKWRRIVKHATPTGIEPIEQKKKEKDKPK